jgi:hypothetical protein
MKVCMYVWPTQPITPKFGMGSSFHRGSAPSQGATHNFAPQPAPGTPTSPPMAHPLLPLSSLDQSARDYFTIVLWNSPEQRQVAHACILYLSLIFKTMVSSSQLLLLLFFDHSTNVESHLCGIHSTWLYLLKRLELN